MPRCKVPEILRSEAYIECTLQRRRIRETPKMGVFQQAAKERRGVEREQMVAPPEIRRRGKSELHRAGRSVIQTVPEVCKAEFGNKESATENIPSCGMATHSIPQGKGEKVR
jgi:hypothetical protein